MVEHSSDKNTEAEIVDSILKVLNKITNRQLDANTNRIDEVLLGLNSLEFVSLIIELENTFNIEFDVSKLSKGVFQTINELTLYIVDKVDNNAKKAESVTVK